ncbi:MAG: cation:proton antiporter, partial [Pirellulaceae bacterium]
YRTDLGMVVVSAAVFNDLIGWTVFALVLGLLQPRPSTSTVGMTIAWTMLFMVTVLTLGRWLIHRALLFLQAYTHWPGGVLGFAFTLALLGAACTEALGVHAIFGSFLVGVALGASPRMQERTRAMMDEFVSFVFAPLFFALIGLRVDFIAHFDGQLVLLVLSVACASKFAGAVWGARWGGFAARDAWAIGWAMNARGAMEIILGLLALEAGVIRQPLFVALVIMALATSALSGPAMRWILRRRQTRLLSLLSSRMFVRDLNAETPREAIQELVGFVCRGSTLDAQHVESLVWAREEMAATGIGHGVALPHARLDGLESPLVAVGLSDAGIPFDAPDGQPAHVLFLMLTPGSEPTLQLDLSASIAGLFSDPRALGKVLRASNFTEFLATMRALDAQVERP